LNKTISYLFRLGREGFCKDVAMPLLEMKKKLAFKYQTETKKFEGYQALWVCFASDQQ